MRSHFAKAHRSRFPNLGAALAAAGSRNKDLVEITLPIEDHDPERLAHLGEKQRAVFGAPARASTR